MLFLAAASSASYLIIRSLETQVGEMPVGWTQLLFLGGGPMAYTVFFASCVYIAGVFPQRHALVVRRPRLAPALYITAFSAVLISRAARWREQAAQFTAHGWHTSVEAPESMPTLSATVEVAVSYHAGSDDHCTAAR